MTARLADFVASPEGDLYRRYCEHYGRRPGELFSDDVVGFQVDMAYMVDMKPKAPHPDLEPFT